MPKLLGPNEVILVDDNPDDRFVAKTCFKRAGLPNEWREFPSGDLLLEYLARLVKEERTRPSLILLDINMPCLNGFETLQRIRQNPAFKHSPPLIMLTGSKNGQDLTKSKSYGADEYFVKPTTLEEYIEFFKSLAA